MGGAEGVARDAPHACCRTARHSMQHAGGCAAPHAFGRMACVRLLCLPLGRPHGRAAPGSVNLSACPLPLSCACLCAPRCTGWPCACVCVHAGDILGHEFMGVVEAVGPEVQHVKVRPWSMHMQHVNGEVPLPPLPRHLANDVKLP